jgi:hypothetical protein
MRAADMRRVDSNRPARESFRMSTGKGLRNRRPCSQKTDDRSPLRRAVRCEEAKRLCRMASSVRQLNSSSFSPPGKLFCGPGKIRARSTNDRKDLSPFSNLNRDSNNSGEISPVDYTAWSANAGSAVPISEMRIDVVAPVLLLATCMLFRCLQPSWWCLGGSTAAHFQMGRKR